MGACCETCAKAAKPVAMPCDPCAQDVGVLFSAARPGPAVGIRPPAGPEWTTPIAEMLANPETQPKIPAARLYVLAVNELARPEVRRQMSIFGALSSDVLTTATRIAAEASGNTVSQEGLLGAGRDVLMAIYDALPKSTNAVVDALKGMIGKSTAALGSAVAEALPIIGAFVSFFTSVEDFYSAKAIADAQIAALVCQQSYRPPVATRAAVYGGMTPADLMQASVGDAFSAMESSLPERIANECAASSFIKAAVERGGLKCGVYIPAETRRVLRILRLAIQNSWKDPNSDAGLALWPAYLDLMHAQFKQGRIDRHWASELVDKEVLPSNRNGFVVAKTAPDTSIADHQLSRMHLHKTSATGLGDALMTNGIDQELKAEWRWSLKPGRYATQFSGGDWRVSEGRCLASERRGFDEFLGQMQEWELFINPTYRMDVAKAVQMRGTIEGIVSSISAPRTLSAAPARTPVGKGQRAALAQRFAASIEAKSSSSGGAVVLIGAAAGIAYAAGVFK